MAVAEDRTTTRPKIDLPLDDIQGNILAPFNKPFQAFLFLNFRNAQKGAREWISALVEDENFASTSKVFAHASARKKNAERRCWVSVGLTSSGLTTLHPELAVDLVAYDAFSRGVLADREYRGERRISPALVGDTRAGDPTTWAIGGPDDPSVDALVTIAADDYASLEKVAEGERLRAERCGLQVLKVRQREGDAARGQYCERLDDGREHFGFKDGVSQPGIRGFTPEIVRNKQWEAADQPGSPIIAAGEFVLGHERERGSYPDAPRPNAPSWMHNGSFQVFLRLTQDVDGWKTQMGRLRASSKEDVDVAAKAIGRREDGSPLASHPADELNDFTYDDDPDGVQTPAFAHIRKVNPREEGLFRSRIHRVLRRGISFGKPWSLENPNDGVERGLVFNAFMASIEDQFEFMQRSWANNPDPPADLSSVAEGPDPVIGASDAPRFLRFDGKSEKEPVELHFKRFVRTTGAVYAFAPSIPTLRMLGSAQRIPVGGA